jgi:hypothetical protein
VNLQAIHKRENDPGNHVFLTNVHVALPSFIIDGVQRRTQDFFGSMGMLIAAYAL